MAIKDYKTKINYVKAVQWDGTDTVYDELTPYIGSSIASYVKLNGQDVGTLRIRKTCNEVIVVEKGQYIVIVDIKIGSFKIMSEADFVLRYEPVTDGGSGVIPDGDDEVIVPPTTGGDKDDTVTTATTTFNG